MQSIRQTLFYQRVTKQIFFHIPHKLITAALKLAQHAVDAALALELILFGDARAVDGADLKLDLGKRHLIKHQAASGVELLANNNGGFNLGAVLVNQLSGKKSIVARVARLVLGNDRISRHTVFGKHVDEKFTFRPIIARIDVGFVGNAGPRLPPRAHRTRGDDPLGVSATPKFSGVFGLLGVHTARQKEDVCHLGFVANKYVVGNIIDNAIVHSPSPFLRHSFLTLYHKTRAK